MLKDPAITKWAVVGALIVVAAPDLYGEHALYRQIGSAVIFRPVKQGHWLAVASDGAGNRILARIWRFSWAGGLRRLTGSATTARGRPTEIMRQHIRWAKRHQRAEQEDEQRR